MGMRVWVIGAAVNMFINVACCPLLSAAPGCNWLMLAAVDCCRLLLTAVRREVGFTVGTRIDVLGNQTFSILGG